MRLRRADLRTLVGAGAGAAIAAAFGAPLAGAFYAFEIVIGAYTPSAIAPVAAALAGALVAQTLGARAYLIDVAAGPAVEPHHYVIYAGLGGACALLGIGLMRAGADELAVLADDRRVLGLVSETYVRRRSAEELEKAQRELFGER